MAERVMATPVCDIPVLDCDIQQVLVVDDHPFYATGLAQTLEQQHGIARVATATTLAEADDALEKQPGTDLILLDLRLRDHSGLSLFQLLRDRHLPIPVVIISARDDVEAIRSAHRAGAMGFLNKSCDQRALATMLSRIAGGELCFPDVALQDAPQRPSLTPRQQQVLALLAQGHPDKRICQKLSLTPHTVRSHLKSLYALLSVHNRTECVSAARSLGLVE